LQKIKEPFKGFIACLCFLCNHYLSWKNIVLERNITVSAIEALRLFEMESTVSVPPIMILLLLEALLLSFVLHQ